MKAKENWRAEGGPASLTDWGLLLQILHDGFWQCGPKWQYCATECEHSRSALCDCVCETEMKNWLAQGSECFSLSLNKSGSSYIKLQHLEHEWKLLTEDTQSGAFLRPQFLCISQIYWHHWNHFNLLYMVFKVTVVGLQLTIIIFNYSDDSSLKNVPVILTNSLKP